MELTFFFLKECLVNCLESDTCTMCFTQRNKNLKVFLETNGLVSPHLFSVSWSGMLLLIKLLSSQDCLHFPFNRFFLSCINREWMCVYSLGGRESKSGFLPQGYGEGPRYCSGVICHLKSWTLNLSNNKNDNASIG